ncbi:flagellar basal body-associated FliL family protein [Cellulomonas sp. APG4]|uniref:flagellar basal body-associated FliL family protein n=1 Tax=Cellulomonas sp. APG4 TaxID=1538656 RepID=UPI00137A35CF|nr:flagellar basal body-associated FliL family protein [Cellulomonas sp. APG4]NCT92654.1 flagellar basal body-associated FliL family protein [Cellulomonas sp. APG4]
MPTEQRIISSRSPGAARPAPGGSAPEPAAAEAEGKGKGKKKPLLIAVVLLVVLAAGAGWYFLMGPGAGGAEGTEVVEEPAPEAGEVLTIEPISLNLAGGSYLRIGIGLQLTAEVADEPDPAIALDHVIALYSGRPVEEVTSAEGREALRVELSTRLEEAYHGDVMGVYYTDYVTQ